MEGEGIYDVTAISFHAYPYIQENYALLPSGGSVGEGYGPMIVATQPYSRERDQRKTHRRSRGLDHRLSGLEPVCAGH